MSLTTLIQKETSVVSAQSILLKVRRRKTRVRNSRQVPRLMKIRTMKTRMMRRERSSFGPKLGKPFLRAIDKRDLNGSSGCSSLSRSIREV